MRLFRKSLLAVLCCALAGGAMAKKEDKKDKPKDAATEAAGKPDDKKKDPKKKDKKKNENVPEPGKPSGDATPEEKKKISIPVSEGRDSTGIKVPYYDTEGNLQMKFYIGVASRVDADHVKMTDTQVETYNEEGEPEMTVDLPLSMLDLNTRVISSHTQTTIKREDFKLTGDAAVFDTTLRKGKLIGNVHMTIYKSDLAGTKPSAVPPMPEPPSTAPAKPE